MWHDYTMRNQVQIGELSDVQIASIEAYSRLPATEAAEELDISGPSFRNHMARGKNLLQVSGTEAAIYLLARSGIIEVSENEHRRKALLLRQCTPRQVSAYALFLGDFQADGTGLALGISSNTVRSHVAELRTRTGINNVIHLARPALVAGVRSPFDQDARIGETLDLIDLIQAMKDFRRSVYEPGYTPINYFPYARG
jgi:DNA-binding CsgD family transcriptional regulator